ncbi:MAG: DUF481 domain-containing protein [Gemmatimonas sp.]
MPTLFEKHLLLNTSFITMIRVAVGLGAISGTLGAQEAPVPATSAPPARPTTHWRATVDASGTILYGAANQRTLNAGVGTTRLDPEYEIRLDLQSGYGDSRNQDTGVRSVIARNVRLSGAYDLHPHDRTSPFALVSAESNYQQRYKSRVSGGIGAKQTFWRPDSVINGFVQDASVSLAVLAENTRLLADAPDVSRETAGSRARYSLRARFRKRIGHDVRFTHITLYQPTTNNLGRYTLDAVTELAVPLRTRLQFTISHRERLDSEAVKRGAPSIRDGQVVFGLRATF